MQNLGAPHYSLEVFRHALTVYTQLGTWEETETHTLVQLKAQDYIIYSGRG
jgi:hypothetical protein